MPPTIRSAYRQALGNAREERVRGDLSAAFAQLERAHILGQRYLLPHIVTHILMLRIGWSRRDPREVIGQLVRLIATVPGYLIGWVSKGNTGGANVSALRPMPLSGDLEGLLQDFSVWRDVGRRAVLYAGTLVAGFALLLWADARRGAEAAELEAAWAQRVPQPHADFGTTSFVEITPVVNLRGRPNLKTEPGVSYLIRTDQHTVLFDLGFNRSETSPSPVEHNLAAIGVDLQDLDGLFLSHAHRDHVGGTRWEAAGSFSFGLEQRPLPPDLAVLAPIRLTYPGTDVAVADRPTAWLPGLASSGPIPRRLMLGRIDEQALLIHVEGRGLVAVVGCGHQTVPKLLAHVRENFDVPLIGLVGDVHYPVPEGRLFIAGIDAQRWLASGDGPFAPIDRAQIESELHLLSQQVELLALGAHDTSDAALELAAARLGNKFEPVIAGKPICIEAPSSAGDPSRCGRR